MSYCRFSDKSDVYFYPHITNGLTCCGCKLTLPTVVSKPDSRGVYTTYQGHANVIIATHEEAIEHLLEHRKRGEKVPQYAIRRLEEEMKVMREWEEEQEA